MLHIVQVSDVIDWCRDSLYSILDQFQVLDDIPCSVGDLESQISEVEVEMTAHSVCDILLVLKK